MDGGGFDGYDRKPMYWSEHMKVKTDRDIEERAVILSEYIIEHKATVRAAATQFGISKYIVHIN